MARIVRRPCLTWVLLATLVVPLPPWAAFSNAHPQSNPPQEQRATTGAPQTAPVLKVEVRVVVLDVVVIGKKGQPVTGLRKDQFAVLEDGVPQTVASFEEHHDAQPPPNAARAAVDSRVPLPPDVYTSSQTVKPSDSVNVLLLDWLNTQPSDQPYVRSQVIKYLKTVRPGTRLAIFTLTPELRIVQGFTTETARLLDAVNNQKAAAATKSVGLLASQSRKAGDQELIEMMTKANTAPAAIAAVRDFQSTTNNQETGDRSALTIAGLRELQSYLSPIPGRKNVLWFAGEFPIKSFPGVGAGGGPPVNFVGSVRQTADEFGPDRIAIYPISAAGMAESAGLDPSQGLDRRARVMPAGTEQDNSSGVQQAAMETIAKETGGEAFYNTNALDRQITRAVEDAAHYYTISYSPTNATRDGKFRSIQVKLAEGNYHLSYRRGYYAETQAQLAAQAGPSDPLLELMRFGMPDFDQLVYRVRIAPDSPQPAAGAKRAGVNQDLPPPLTRYGVDFTIPLRALKLAAANDGTCRGTLELMLVAYEKNGTPLNLATTTNEFKVPAKLLDSDQNVEIHARQEIDLPNRDLYLRAGFYEPASGNVGTIGISLSPPTTNPGTGVLQQ
jgi:VWFA-related protein